MAANNVAPNTLITTKLLYNGSIRRFKIYLKDCGANTLPGKLKELLSIPESEEAIFERWSDSAATYILLDSNKPAVYKQLYRAAKAKLKLRIRVSVPLPDAPLPQPFTASASSETLLPPYSSTTSVPLPSVLPEAPTAETTESTPVSAETAAEVPVPLESISAAVAAYFDTEEGRTMLHSTIEEEMGKEIEKLSIISQSVASITAQPQPAASESSAVVPKPKSTTKQVYAVYCNVCSVDVDSVHYHCAICDGGDFDLCEKCVTEGKHCENSKHWMVKRCITNGEVVSSREYVAGATSAPPNPTEQPSEENQGEELGSGRTCNCCCEDYPEAKFVECTVCPDYDLCLSCHVKQIHGHNPSHGFKPAVPGTALSVYAQNILTPGRNFLHFATCDGCESQIYGARHKCLSCPDWDYCSECFKYASEVHPGHRFGTFYEALPDAILKTPTHHYGVYCDGPLCVSHGDLIWISGDRYKCAICPDFDLCASCEASPLNKHNPTHPLIKFKSPVRNVTVSTMDQDTAVQLGDHIPVSAPSSVTTTSVQTVAEVQPTQESTPDVPEAPVKEEITPEAITPLPPVAMQDSEKYITERGNVLIHGCYEGQKYADGAKFKAGDHFTQTWVVRNDGFVSWPAGTTMAFTGGDEMSGKVTTFTEAKIESGTVVNFSVDFIVPMQTSGRLISYWNLCTADGIRFGPQLWCEIAVQAEKEEEKVNVSVPVSIVPISLPKEENAVEQPKEAAVVEVTEEQTVETEEVVDPLVASHVSEMIFPTLDTEAPVANPNATLPSTSAVPAPTPITISPSTLGDVSDDAASEGYSIDDEDELENFISDDEDYEVLMASDDEEFGSNASSS